MSNAGLSDVCIALQKNSLRSSYDSPNQMVQTKTRDYNKVPLDPPIRIDVSSSIKAGAKTYILLILYLM